MKLRFNPRQCGNVLLVLLAVLILLHCLVFAGVLDPSLFWDTTITNFGAVRISETIVIVLLLFFGIGIWAKLGRAPFRFLQQRANGILWAMLVYFILSLVGAFLSGQGTRKMVMLVLTVFVCALLIPLILAPIRGKRKKQR